MMYESSLTEWINGEFQGINLGDKRLDERFKNVALGLAKNSEKNICSSFSNWGETKAAYRFFNNPKVTCESMHFPHRKRTLQRIQKHNKVLLLQDTVFFMYGDGRTGTKNLDICSEHRKSKREVNGLMMHGQLALSTDGVPLGLLEYDFIQRDKLLGKTNRKKYSHMQLPISHKESQRWINFVHSASLEDIGSTEAVHIADREGDIYELYRDCTLLEQSFVFRACYNRVINKSKRRSPPKEKMFDLLEKQKAQGVRRIKIQTLGRGKKYRTVKLSIIYKEVTLSPPPNKTVNKDGECLLMLPLTAIMAIERNPPKGVRPIKWVLLTNMPINSIEQAEEKIRWYSLRWNIELYHKILKSGFALEKSQQRDGDRLKKYIIMKSMLAWRIFWLTRFCSISSSKSCEEILTSHEWKILYIKFKKRKNFPSRPPSVKDVTIWIGKLGGFLGRTSDGLPGITSMWRGWTRFMDLIEDYEAFCG